MLRLCGMVHLPHLTRFGAAVFQWDRIMCWVVSLRGDPALLPPRRRYGWLPAAIGRAHKFL